MSLADNIRRAAQEKSTENMPQGGQTAALQTQLAAGATGKAQEAGQNLKQSNIAEQMGMVNARGMQEDVQQEGMEQASKVAAKEATQEVEAKRIAAANRTKEMEHQAVMADQNDQLLATMKASEAKLEDREDAFELEQVASRLRLQDKKYVHEVQMIGKRNRIDSGRRIALEAERLAIGTQTQQLYTNLENKYQLAEMKREDIWKDTVMGLDDAFKIAESKLEDERTAMTISTVRDLAVTGAEVYSHESELAKKADKAHTDEVWEETFGEGSIFGG